MTEAEALRVLGLEGMGSPAFESDTCIDADNVRNAFSAQMRVLRGARRKAGSVLERQRIDRALSLTLLARDRLLPADGRAFAVTQDLARIQRPRVFWHALAVLLIGFIMVILGLLPEPAQETESVVVPLYEELSPPAPAAEDVPVTRALLDSVRLALQEQWQQTPSLGWSWLLPGETDLDALAPPPLPAGWHWQGQRDGAFAAIDMIGQDWLLAAPLWEDGSLYWACFSARPGRTGCYVIADDAILERRLPRGQVGARLLAEALARLPDSQRQEGWSPQRWYRQAAR